MDLRTERTRKSIVNAFLELRVKKPIEKISIKELAELACINKATFYSHYHDIYDLSEQLENEVITSIILGIQHPDRLIKEPKQIVYEMTKDMIAKEKLLNTLFSGSRAGLLMKKLALGLKERIFAQYPEYRENVKWNLVISVIVYGNFYAFLEQKENDVEQVCELLGDISACLSEKFLQ